MEFENEYKALINWFDSRRGRSLKLNDNGINIVISALEKQIPKKARLSQLSTKKNKLYICPNCSNQCLKREANERQDNMYCWNCGQAIVFSEE